MKKLLFVLILSFSVLNGFSTAISVNSTPLIGAQVIIERGQTPEEIDLLFSRLAEANMNFCRIRMFESYMRDTKGNWDFRLFDLAFEAAQRHGVQILATLFPDTEFTDIGGFKFPRTEQHSKSIANYIKQVTTHYKNHKALYGWVLMNEVGIVKAPIEQRFTANRFRLWQKTDTVKPFNLAGYPVMTFQKERFLLDYTTWYLQWLSTQVKKYDTAHHLHVNAHAIFDTYSEYNFTKWRGILDSFGGSAHASWHFGNFSRNQYHYAMSANSEILRSGAGDKPWIMTELQGGNNIWSGGIPMCPTKEEIEQWMWTVIGTGGKGMIFWSLNPRTSGIEAGEWALLNYLNQPSDRMEMAAKTAGIINKYADVFASAKVEESGVSILYTRESLWVERNAQKSGQNMLGRAPGAAIKSVIGFYETLSQMGIQCNIKCIDEYDFTDKNVRNKIVIIPHQIALQKIYKQLLTNFVANGGQLIIEGLTAYFDENMHLQFSAQFPYRDSFGGLITEAPLKANLFNIQFLNSTLVLPAHAWEGHIQTEHSGILAINDSKQTIASLNNFGKGRVIWIPSCVALAARETSNYQPLSDLLSKYVVSSLNENTIRFKQFTPGVLMKVLATNSGRVLVLINKSGLEVSIELTGIEASKRLIQLNSSIQNEIEPVTISLQNEETKVFLLK
ncbi:MAG: hypothetical protein GZ091_02670 [Paludibacter sp.]|nr:hypothetical protein [Paludibacter sp.]